MFEREGEQRNELSLIQIVYIVRIMLVVLNVSTVIIADQKKQKRTGLNLSFILVYSESKSELY